MATSKWIIGTGEYNCFIINNGQIYDISSAIPSKVQGQPATVVDVRGCLHHQLLIDGAANLYVWGKTAGGETGQPTSTIPTPLMVLKDSTGKSFGNVAEAIPYCNGIGGNGVLIRKNDGTVWIMWNTQTGMRGDGTQGQFNDAAPVQVIFPAGVSIKKIQAGVYCAALDTSGTVWTWGGGGSTGDLQWWPTYLLARGIDKPDYTRPGKVNLPGPVTDICAGGLFNYAIVGGLLYGWAYYPEYLTGSPSGTPVVSAGNTPVWLDKLLNLPAPISKLAMSTVATYAILNNGSLYGWGDNACGFIGIGKELDFSKYKTPYAWDWGRMELPQPPVQIGAGLLFANVATGLGDVFYAYAEDELGNLYSWGRNKNGGMLGNGVVSTDPTGNLGANYPNSWDVPWITSVSPLSIIATKATTSPICLSNPGTPYCSALAPLAISGPRANAGANQSINAAATTLDGSGSTGTINYYLWKQVSGPSTTLITLPSSPTATVSGLVQGTYVFQLTVTDNNWKSDSATTTVAVTQCKSIATVTTKTTILWSDGTTTVY